MRLITRKWIVDRKGATAIEYAFVGSLISIAIIAAAAILGGSVEDSFDDTASQVEDAHNRASGD